MTKQKRVRLEDPNECRRRAARQWRGIHAHRLKLDEDLIEQFCDLVREGVAPDTCAHKLRISTATFRRWIRRGKAFEENDCQPEEDIVYFAFLQEFYHARAEFLIRMTKEALRKDASARHVKRALEVLRRRDPENWCVRAEQKQSHADFDEWSAPDMAFL